MSTRTKELPFSTVEVGVDGYARRYYSSNGEPSSGPVATATSTYKNINRISYEVGPQSAYRTKNCRHEVLKSEPIPLTGFRKLDSNEDYYYDGVSWWGFLRTGDNAMSSIEPDSGTIASFNAEAFDAMKPSFEGDLQLTNFLLELLDLKRILQLGNRWGGILKGYKRFIRTLRGKSKADALKAVAAEVAAGHLAWSFGVKPFVSDVMTLYTMLTEFSVRVADFLAKRGVPQVRHYKKVLVNDEGVSEQSLSSYTKGHVTYTRNSVMNATMRYTYDCPDVITMGQKLDVLRDSLGLRFGVPQLWEAIPFSFVVDWFFRVGDWTDRHFQKPLFPVTLTVTDFCVSRKCEINTSGIIELQDARLGPNPAYQDIGSHRHKLYVRERQIPSSGATFINSGHYGQNQLALSASLLTSIAYSRR